MTDAAIENDPEFLPDITAPWRGGYRPTVRSFLAHLAESRRVELTQEEKDLLERWGSRWASSCRELVEACKRRGLALQEVSRETPFMGIIRAVSDAVAAEERARLERSLIAQRAPSTSS